MPPPEFQSAPAFPPATSARPILIVGASVRAAAFSALRAGLRPICADLFGDQDLRDIAHWTLLKDYGRDIPHFLQQHPGFPWMYTGGIENYPDQVEEWEKLSQETGGNLWGNRGCVLRRTRDPHHLEKLLKRAGLPALESLPETAPPSADGDWMRKPCRGAGGRGVVVWDADARDRAEKDPLRREPVYFQRRVDGQPISGLFLAANGRTTLLGTALQLIRNSDSPRHQFAYAGSIAPFPMSPRSNDLLRRIGQLIGRETGLQGLFGCDFLLNDDVPWLTEVNPRYTASVELIEYATGTPLLNWHGAVFSDCATDSLDVHVPLGFTDERVFGKSIYYAESDLIMPSLAAGNRIGYRGFEMPDLADLPAGGAEIPVGAPVCSRFVHASTIAACQARLSAAPELF